jgi:hypothetical protein
MLMAFRDVQARKAKHETGFHDSLLPKPVPQLYEKVNY